MNIIFYLILAIFIMVFLSAVLGKGEFARTVLFFIQKHYNKIFMVIIVVIIGISIKNVLTPMSRLTPYYNSNGVYQSSHDIKMQAYMNLIIFGIVISFIIYSHFKNKKNINKDKKSNPHEFTEKCIPDEIKNKAPREIDYLAKIDDMARYGKTSAEIAWKLGLNDYFIDSLDVLRKKFDDDYINKLIRVVKYRVDNDIVILKAGMPSISEEEKLKVIENEKFKKENILKAAKLFEEGFIKCEVSEKVDLIPIYINVTSEHYKEINNAENLNEMKDIIRFFYLRSEEYREFIEGLVEYYDFLKRYLPEAHSEFVRDYIGLDKKSYKALKKEFNSKNK